MRSVNLASIDLSDVIMSAKPYKTYAGAHPSTQINTLRKLPNDRLLLTLTRLRDAIAAGRELVAYSEPDCSWGLCHDSKETWPDAQDHIFPIDFEKSGRISHLHSKANACPLDRRNDQSLSDDLHSGCFYTCMVLKQKRGNAPITREMALQRYDAAIKRLKEKA